MTHAALDIAYFPSLRKHLRKSFVFLMRIALIFSIIIVLFLAGCATTVRPRPNNVENICSIFSQYPDWYAQAKQTEAKWGIPVSVQMSIIYYESAFIGNAKTPRKKGFLFFPGKHISSAVGYSQALNQTWQDYQYHTGNNSGKRHEFSDACDFIGWYSQQVHHNLRVPPNNAYALYLAYHEGMGGYSRYSYLKKPWLIRIARKVSARSKIYQQQLMSCQGGLDSR